MDDGATFSLIASALSELRVTADLEGASVLDVADMAIGPILLHQTGMGGPNTARTACDLLRQGTRAPTHLVDADRRPIMVCPWVLPPGRPGGLVMWRSPGSRGWSAKDHPMAASSAAILRIILERGPHDSGIDRLTGLPNRAWFLDEVDRHMERLVKDDQPGTLVLVDIDNLQRLNTGHGRDAGDWMLVRVASLLRAMVRPSDIVARVGGDEFALWLDGMDYMTAAERAEDLRARRLVPPDVMVETPAPPQTLSVGIASWRERSEDAQTLLRRAHMAIYEVKKAGGAGWKVSHASLAR